MPPADPVTPVTKRPEIGSASLSSREDPFPVTGSPSKTGDPRVTLAVIP